MVLTVEEKNKIEVIMAVMDGRIEVRGAGRVLERSDRTIYRMVKRVRERGIQGLIHGNKGGRESHRKTNKVVQNRIVALAKGKYQHVNDTHLKELLLKREEIEIGKETLRVILRKAGFHRSGSDAVRSIGSVGSGKRRLG